MDPAAVQCLLLVALLLCGGCLSGDTEIGRTEVFAEEVFSLVLLHRASMDMQLSIYELPAGPAT